jgi:hypothetical protein
MMRATIRTINQPGVRISRALRDGFSLGHVPGNKLPGYFHNVPSGQGHLTPVHEFGATSTIEDQDSLPVGLTSYSDVILFGLEDLSDA